MSGSDWLRQACGRGAEVAIAEGEDGNAIMNSRLRRPLPATPEPDPAGAAQEEWRATYDAVLAALDEPEPDPFRGSFDAGPRGQTAPIRAVDMNVLIRHDFNRRRRVQEEDRHHA